MNSIHKKQKVTMRTISEQLGVSQATVSYVLSGRRNGGSISEETTRRIKKAAKSLGYAHNPAARSLISGKAYAVGIITSFEDMLNHMAWSKCIGGIQSRLIHAGYQAVIQDAGDDAGKTADMLIARRYIDAAIIVDAPRKKRAVNPDAPPPVTVNLQREGPAPCVEQDSAPGLYEAVRHLHALGHRRLLLIDPMTAEAQSISQRMGWVAEETERLGMRFDHVSLDLGFQYFFDSFAQGADEARRRVAERLPHELEASAILCWNDRMALMVLDELRRRGVRVPEDLSLVGYDNFITEWTVPALSTVSAQFADFGRAAADLTISMLKGELSHKEARKTTVRVATQFIPRATTAAAKRNMKDEV